jgi:type I restriction enzyme S subunit
MNGFYDGPHATPDPAEEGPMFLGIKNIFEEGGIDFSDIRHISEDEYKKWTKRVIPTKNDLVFSYEATLHRYAIIPEGFRGCLGRRMALIIVNKSIVNERYLYYYFLSPQWRAYVETIKISGSTVDRISISEFPNYKISLPTLPIQNQIASILSSYDELIENNKQRIKLLEEMAAEIYKEWFVRMRFPGYETAKFVNEQGVEVKRGTEGALPEGWEEKEFQFFGEIITGKTPSTLNEEFFNGDIPFVKTPDMNNAIYVISTTETLSEIGANSQIKKFIPKNSLMVSCIGSAGVYSLASKDCQTNQQINSVAFYEDFYSFYFYCYASKLKELLANLGSNGATMTNVNKSKFEKLKLI